MGITMERDTVAHDRTWRLLKRHARASAFASPSSQENGDKKIEFKPGFLMEHDRDVGVVVVGFDQFMNYYKIQYATLCIRETEDAFSLLPIEMLLVILLMHKNGQVNPSFSFTKEEVEYLTNRIQNGGTEVVEAFTAAKFVDACLHGLWGDAGFVQCATVVSEVTGLPFFASKVRLGRAGVEECFPLGPMSAYERSVNTD